jgi:hypothetical protein
MITTKTQAKLIEWLSSDEMYQASKKWHSELSFIKDEQLFFDGLIKTYTLQLLDKNKFEKNKKSIEALNTSQKKVDELLEIVQTHSNDLEILVDGINQPKEEASYKKEHKGLIIILSEFFIEYKNLKTELFQMIKDILKAEKQRHLINKK